MVERQGPIRALGAAADSRGCPWQVYIAASVGADDWAGGAGMKVGFVGVGNMGGPM